MKKTWIATLLLVLATQAHAGELLGRIFYAGAEGEIVSRDSTLSIPERENGDIFLKAGGKDLRAEGFEALKQNGRTIFYVVFLNPPQGAANTALVLKGTYVKGSNKAVYYGDMFTMAFDPAKHAQVMNALRSLHDHPGEVEGLSYQGGFTFNSAP